MQFLKWNEDPVAKQFDPAVPFVTAPDDTATDPLASRMLPAYCGKLNCPPLLGVPGQGLPPPVRVLLAPLALVLAYIVALPVSAFSILISCVIIPAAPALQIRVLDVVAVPVVKPLLVLLAVDPPRIRFGAWLAVVLQSVSGG